MKKLTTEEKKIVLTARLRITDLAVIARFLGKSDKSKWKPKSRNDFLRSAIEVFAEILVKGGSVKRTGFTESLEYLEDSMGLKFQHTSVHDEIIINMQRENLETVLKDTSGIQESLENLTPKGEQELIEKLKNL